MKIKLILLVPLTAIYVSSCTVMGTLYGLTENPARYVFKSELIGKWSEPRDSSLFYVIDTFRNNKGRLYKIDVVDITDSVADTTSFRGYIINVDGWYFLDCWYNLKRDLRELAVVRHFPIRLSFIAPGKLEFSAPEPDKLLRLIDQQKIKLTYAKQEENSTFDDYSYLVLDRSAALQRALIETKKYPVLYKVKDTLIRLN